MFTSDIVIKQLQEKSVQIGHKFDNLYLDRFNEIATELAIAFSDLNRIVKTDHPNDLEESDHTAGMLLWTASNTILSGLDLFRRGYSKEPLMLLRNAIETICSAYAIHLDPQKLETLKTNPDNFRSIKHIGIANNFHPLIRILYDMLSDSFVHVNQSHVLPHNSDDPFCIGGLYDSKKQDYQPLTLSMYLTVGDILNSFIECIYYKYLAELRYCKFIERKGIVYRPSPEMKERQKRILNEMAVLFEV